MTMLPQISTLSQSQGAFYGPFPVAKKIELHILVLGSECATPVQTSLFYCQDEQPKYGTIGRGSVCGLQRCDLASKRARWGSAASSSLRRVCATCGNTSRCGKVRAARAPDVMSSAVTPWRAMCHQDAPTCAKVMKRTSLGTFSVALQPLPKALPRAVTFRRLLRFYH